MLALAPLFAFVALVAAQAPDPSISTPAAVVQCQPAQITFTATKTPVFISIIPGGQPSAAPLQDLGQQNASPFTWVASIAANTQITFQIRDSTGAVAYSAPVTIQGSSDSSCLGAGASSGGGSSAASTATAPGSSSSAAVSSASVSSASTSSAAASSSFVASTSSVIASVSSNVASATSTSRASSAASNASTRSAASVTSTSPSASASANAARSNAQVGFAGLLGLAAAVVMA